MPFPGAAFRVITTLLVAVCLVSLLLNPDSTSEKSEHLSITYQQPSNSSTYCLQNITERCANTSIWKGRIYANVEDNRDFCNVCNKRTNATQQLEYILRVECWCNAFSKSKKKHRTRLEYNCGWSCENNYASEECRNITNTSENFTNLCCKQWDVTKAVIVICTLCFCIYKGDIVHQAFIKNSNLIIKPSKSFNNIKPEIKVPDYIFKFRMKWPGRHVTIAWPFSLNQYADEVVRQNRSGDALMKFEWARYMSFKTFPQESIMTPMRLSQAGFFYTGRGEEVKCFSCGVINDQWSREETAQQVHARLSPRCAFINGQNTANVTIHTSEYYTNGFQSQEDVGQPVGRIRPQAGASGGPSDRFDSNPSSSGEQSARRNGRDDNTPSAAGNISTVPQNGNQRTERTSPETPANRSQAKHPEYERFETRLDTFSKWTSHDIQDPREMAETGLFYTYIRDFVRCYHCGIGLKNWERGDNPQEEHKRWSPSCGFLLQNSSQVSAQTRETTEPGVTQNAENASTNSTAAPSTSATNTTQPNRPRETGTAAEGATSSGENIVTPTTRVAKPEANGERKVEDSSTSYASAGAPSERSSLVDENRNLRAQMTCKICLDRDSNVVFLPCGHMTACKECAQSLRKCAICRKLIRGSVIVYQS